MNPTQLGQLGLRGWRQKVADVAAGPLSQRTPLSAAQARALLGGVFFALSTFYVVSAGRDMVRQARG